MSQETYELLLETNQFFSQEQKEEAVLAYREVLRLGAHPTPLKVGGRAVVEASNALKRRSFECDEAFQERVLRYNIWLTYRATHPDIDINTANRLAETGWTLAELREAQSQRRQRYLSRRKEFLRKRREQSREFSGTQYLESVIADGVELWGVDCGGVEWSGRLLKNSLYRWHIRDESEQRRVLHKLQLGCVCEFEQRAFLWEFCRLDKEQQQRGELPPELPQQRLKISDQMLHNSLKEEQLLAIQLYNGLCFVGWVYWYDPYQLSLVLNVNAEEGDELVEVMVFRHSIKSIQSQTPRSWKKLPSLLSCRKSDGLL